MDSDIDQKTKWLSFKAPSSVANPKELIKQLQQLLDKSSCILTINFVTSTAAGGDRLRVRVDFDTPTDQVQGELSSLLTATGLELGEYLGVLKFETVKE